jgi:TatD DNase family protein
MVVTGADRQGSHEAMALANAHRGVLYATAGVHPHHAADYDTATDADIRTLAASPVMRAVGETGLDYYRNFSSHAAQRTAFEKQLAIAIELEMPVFLHQRDAHADFLAILKSARAHLPAAVVHCFTDTRAALIDYLDLDCHIGITGWICDERRGTHLRECVREIPTDRLMLETDAPYLLPRDLRPKPPHRRNEPAYLAHICRVLARHRGEDPTVTAANATAAASAFFRLPA